MKDILAEIVAEKKEIVAAAKQQLPLNEVKARLHPGTFRMGHGFRKGDWNLIYEDNGASMLSVHTDPHFLGCNEDFRKVRSEIRLPLLRKDFVIDEYQLYEARMLGADAVLLIARILSPAQLKEYLYTTWSLGMDALIEVHDETDMKAALATPAEFIGINNRNLVTFQTSIQQTLDLLPCADRSRTLISESGVFTADDATILRQAGCDGILVGEGLVRAQDIGAQTQVLSSIAAQNQATA